MANGSSDPAHSQSSKDEEQHNLSSGMRQLLSVTALGFFTLVATVARDRAFNPIIPPLIPVEAVNHSPGADSSHVQTATAAFEHTQSTLADDITPPARPSRSLLRALWGTATLPVKVVDALLFPEEALVGSANAAKGQPAASRSSRAHQPAAQHDSKPRAAAVSKAGAGTAAGVKAAAAAASEPTDAAGAVSLTQDTPTTEVLRQDADVTPVLQQLTAAVARWSHLQQAGSSPAPDAAAVLAGLRVLLGPEAGGLLPVLLVTCATAVAGAVLAASIAGVAGIFDKRRALSPAQRAAQLALLDSPLRPISCPTMPGFLPMLPPSIEPIFYRWRDADTDATDPDSSTSTTSLGSGSGSEEPASASAGPAAAATASATDVEGPQAEQEWWSFAQIAALRMMPLLPSSRTNSSDSSNISSSTTASAAAHEAPTASACAAGASAAAAASGSCTGPGTKQWAELQEALCTSAWSTPAATAGLLDDSSDASILFGPAWQDAVQLAAVDAWLAPRFSQALIAGYSNTAPPQLMAEVLSLLPVAVVNCRHVHPMPRGSKLSTSSNQKYSSNFEQLWALQSQLLSGRQQGRAEWLWAVAEAFGAISSADDDGAQQLNGVCQRWCKQVLIQEGQAGTLRELVYGDLPNIEPWLAQQHRHRSSYADMALRSSVVAMYCFVESCQRESLRPPLPARHSAAANASSNSSNGSSSGGSGGLTVELKALQHKPLLAALLRTTPRLQRSLHELAWMFLQECFSPESPFASSNSRYACFAAGVEGRPFAAVPLPHLTAMEQDQLAGLELPLSVGCYMDDAFILRGVAAATTARKDLYYDTDEALENIVIALQHGVLVVRPSATAMPYPFRPEWPAAQLLALLDALLPPSTSQALLQVYSEEVEGQLLADTFVLLPAGVVHVTRYLQQQVQRALPVSAAGISCSAEATAAAVKRMYTVLLRADEDPAALYRAVLLRMGLEPNAVADAATALAASSAADGAAPAADPAAVLAAVGDWQLQCNDVFRNSEFPLLRKVSEGWLSDDVDNEGMWDIGHAVVESFVVSLALLIEVGQQEGLLYSVRVRPRQRLTPSDSLPDGFWALVSTHVAGSNVAALPGGPAAAAVIGVALMQSRQFDRHSRNRLAASAYAEALAALGFSTTAAYDPGQHQVYEDWEEGLADAVCVREDPGVWHAEVDLEEEDLLNALDFNALPWHQQDDSEDDEAEGEWDADHDSDAEGEEEAAHDSEADAEQEADDSREAEGAQEASEEECWSAPQGAGNTAAASAPAVSPGQHQPPASTGGSAAGRGASALDSGDDSRGPSGGADSSPVGSVAGVEPAGAPVSPGATGRDEREADGRPVVAAVKELLGFPVLASDQVSDKDCSSSLLASRLSLLLCQGMLMRGDDAEQRLQDAVDFLSGRRRQGALRDINLPELLQGCMEAVFTFEDWRCSGPALRTLEAVCKGLTSRPMVYVQTKVIDKGLLEELEVPVEFTGETP